MATYCLFDNIEVLDEAKLKEYKQRAEPLVKKHRGRYVVGGGRVELVEGEDRPTFPVMIEFPSLEKAHEWYDSDEYQELKALRLSAVKSNAFFMEGI